MNSLEIHTNRTTLSLVTIDDLIHIHQLHSLPETDAFNTLGIPENIGVTKTILDTWLLENQKEIINNYTFKISLKNDQQFLGLLGFKLWPQKHRRGEVWYKIHSNYWNKGYATEVLNALISFGFDNLNLHRIQAGCAVDNLASIKVLEKAGMIQEGRGRQLLPLKTGWSDNFEYAILDTDQRIHE
jgi:ribosomal-protein-alanine N-acetyltransferase